MRLTRLELEHFKIIDQADFSLAPVTILIGANNAGKSTVLQALTLLGQSVDHADVTTRGQYLDLGDSASVLVNRSSRVGDGWSVRVTWEDTRPGNHPIAQGRPVRIALKCTAGVPGEQAFTEGTVELEAPAGRRVSVRSWLSAVGPRFEIDADGYADRRQRLSAISEAVTTLNVPDMLGRLPVPPDVGLETEFHPPAALDSAGLIDYAQAVAAPYFRSRIAQTLGSIRYLGVDRHFNQSVFSLSEQMPPFPTEQHGLATVLAYDRDLRRAVDARCREVLGFGVSADFARGRNVDLVATTPAGESISLNNMGAGFGQIVWMATYLELQQRSARDDSDSPAVLPVTCIEEPELHLHPAAQPSAVRMLASYATTGVPQIVATQSEHVLIAFLQQVTARDLDSGDLAVYFLADGSAERLKVDALGRLEGGLKGFFEANEAELLAHLTDLIRQSESGP